MGSAAARAILIVTLLAIAGCGRSGPPPTTYVLGQPAPAAASVEPLAGRPVVEVRPVLVPDYLDVSDLMVRRTDNVVMPSTTGRWGERLSVGFTHALAQALGRRLPGVTVTTAASGDQTRLQVLVDVETFEPRAGGSVVLVARWRITDGGDRRTLAGERVSLTEPIAGSDDAAMVSAMTRAVDDFANRVAAGVRTSLGPRSPRA